jgi:hypothetical protein
VLRRLLAGAAAAAAAALATPGPASAATPTPGPTPSPAICATTGGIRIGPLAFVPPQVPPGRSAAAELAVANCTAGPRTVTETWYGTWLTAAGTGIPGGCPVIDPLLRQVVLAPHQQQSTATVYLVPAGCTADALRVTVQVARNGTVLGQRTADLVIVRPAAG